MEINWPAEVNGQFMPNEHLSIFHMEKEEEGEKPIHFSIEQNI
jgi:hypothetical protein